MINAWIALKSQKILSSSLIYKKYLFSDYNKIKSLSGFAELPPA